MLWFLARIFDTEVVAFVTLATWDPRFFHRPSWVTAGATLGSWFPMVDPLAAEWFLPCCELLINAAYVDSNWLEEHSQRLPHPRK